MDIPRNPPLPQKPEGTSPFEWIVRISPAIREARREAAERYRMERKHERFEELWRVYRGAGR